MKAPFDFVIEPKGNRYNNIKKVGDKDLIINTEIFNHQFINREAVVAITFGFSAFSKKSIGLRKIPPPMPTIPDTSPRIEPIIKE